MCSRFLFHRSSLQGPERGREGGHGGRREIEEELKVEEGRMEGEKYEDYIGGEEGRIGRGMKERMEEEEEGKRSENGSRGWREQIIHT